MKILNKRKGAVERALIALLDVLASFTKAVLSADDYRELKKKLDQVLGIEVDFESAFQDFNDQLRNGFSIPFYWEDLYSIGGCLRKIFNLFIIYYNKSLIYKNSISFKVLLNAQLELLDNIRCFFNEYLENKKYARELLKNNRHQLKAFLRAYFDIVHTRIQDTPAFSSFYEIREIFEKIIEENENIHNLMNKILIGIE